MLLLLLAGAAASPVISQFRQVAVQLEVTLFTAKDRVCIPYRYYHTILPLLLLLLPVNTV
jgi:hypothetical protein